MGEEEWRGKGFEGGEPEPTTASLCYPPLGFVSCGNVFMSDRDAGSSSFALALSEGKHSKYLWSSEYWVHLAHSLRQQMRLTARGMIPQAVMVGSCLRFQAGTRRDD